MSKIVLLNKSCVDQNVDAIVFGNEVNGVEQSVVDKSDYCIEIPQCGTKHSLNVSVSGGIAIWHFFKAMGCC